MINLRSQWIVTAFSLVAFFSILLSIEAGESPSRASSEETTVTGIERQIRDTVKINDLAAAGRWALVGYARTVVADKPYVILSPFGKWNPDTIGTTGSSTICITVTGSPSLPPGTQVTLDFGATMTNGSSSFTITPADPVAENEFTFTIGPDEKKMITARYTARGDVRGSPNVKAICDATVPGGVLAKDNPQTSSSELFIR